MDLDRTTLLFFYGTLKRGFPNHSLLSDLIRSGDAAFIAAGRTARRLPLVVGPFSIPFLLHLPGSGCRVAGELYALSPRGLTIIDEFEGITRGHYERLHLVVVPVIPGGGALDREDDEVKEGTDAVAAGALQAEAYFLHQSFAEAMWRRCEERGLGLYSEDDARGSDPLDTFLPKNNEKEIQKEIACDHQNSEIEENQADFEGHKKSLKNNTISSFGDDVLCHKADGTEDLPLSSNVSQNKQSPSYDSPRDEILSQHDEGKYPMIGKMIVDNVTKENDIALCKLVIKCRDINAQAECCETNSQIEKSKSDSQLPQGPLQQSPECVVSAEVEDDDIDYDLK
ncbi:gamma-glutamylcyclotransferase [Canna indica]|uniref:Gamma-glutamylcyclotransferase family protein n=1 Tax=Canna indica TaxID=4628 RepID=A0AAQ3L3B5_9LILI|nr:gamma-glutamylcyclotransferase [Canna indica]